MQAFPIWWDYPFNNCTVPVLHGHPWQIWKTAMHLCQFCQRLILRIWLLYSGERDILVVQRCCWYGSAMFCITAPLYCTVAFFRLWIRTHGLFLLQQNISEKLFESCMLKQMLKTIVLILKWYEDISFWPKSNRSKRYNQFANFFLILIDILSKKRINFCAILITLIHIRPTALSYASVAEAESQPHGLVSEIGW
jgi:hypothetical protein